MIFGGGLAFKFGFVGLFDGSKSGIFRSRATTQVRPYLFFGFPLEGKLAAEPTDEV